MKETKMYQIRITIGLWTIYRSSIRV